MRHAFTRSFYLAPEQRETEPFVPEGTDLAIWLSEYDGHLTPRRFAAVVFAGKAQKPLWNYSYRTAEERQRKIDETIAGRKATLALKEAQLAARRSYRHDFKPGDILVSSWGYDQTNVDFFEVVGVRGAMVELREVGCREAARDADGPRSYVEPTPGVLSGPVLKRRPGVGGYVKIDNVRSATKWDGRPEYQTASPWGH